MSAGMSAERRSGYFPISSVILVRVPSESTRPLARNRSLVGGWGTLQTALTKEVILVKERCNISGRVPPVSRFFWLIRPGASVSLSRVDVSDHARDQWGAPDPSAAREPASPAD